MADWSKWDYYQDFEIDPAQVDADLTDFPVYLNGADLPSDHKIWTDAQASGGDVKASITDDTEIPIEIVTFDQAGNDFEIHAKPTTVSSTVPTTVRLNFANPADTAHAEDAAYGRENVWNSDYFAVWHLGEDGNTDVGGYSDSTANDNDGTGVSMSPSSDVPGQIGMGQEFDATDPDYIQMSTQVLSGAAWSISAWVYPHRYGGANTGNGIFHQDAVGANLGTNLMVFDGNAPFGNNNLGGRTNASSGFLESDDNSISLNTWQHVVMTNNAGSVSWYVDSVAAGTSAGNSGVAEVASNAYIGTWYDAASNRSYDGVIDEVRAASVERAAAWISAEFNNQDSSSTFYSLPRAIQRHRNRVMSLS